MGISFFSIVIKPLIKTIEIFEINIPDADFIKYLKSTPRKAFKVPISIETKITQSIRNNISAAAEGRL